MLFLRVIKVGGFYVLILWQSWKNNNNNGIVSKVRSSSSSDNVNFVTISICVCIFEINCLISFVYSFVWITDTLMWVKIQPLYFIQTVSLSTLWMVPRLYCTRISFQKWSRLRRTNAKTLKAYSTVDASWRICYCGDEKAR